MDTMPPEWEVEAYDMESARERKIHWRIIALMLVDMGYDDAVVFAQRTDAHVYEAIRLIQDGCPVDTVNAIVL